ncbi:polyprotein [Rhynchospora pubera]|uniref:Polyprotein n=1 Tax=Rhynchospora pubera TaxID=906938 RepID=A0AAV8CFJ6_9POAL|nr:polyprotein [Rhynchospora pubera]
MHGQIRQNANPRPDIDRRGPQTLLPKIEFPNFDGEDPVNWLMECNYYFEMYQVAEVYKSRLDVLHFTKEVKDWYRGVQTGNHMLPWKKFNKVSRMHPIEEFKRCHQVNKVDEYVKQFEKIRMRVLLISNAFTEEDFKIEFVCGLKEEIRGMVKLFKPVSLNKAVNVITDQGDYIVEEEISTDESIEEECEVEEVEQAVISMFSPDKKTVSAMRFKGQIGKTPVYALVDSGSTHSFINPEIITCLQVPVTQTNSMVVMVANGGQMVIDTKCDSLQFSIQGHDFVKDMSGVGLPPRRGIDHQIPLTPDAKPVNLRPYRYSYFQKLEIEKIIEELLKNAVIQNSNSPYASPVLLVRKKDGGWRMCVDYRKLNNQTVKDKFPIPIIEDLLDELHGARYFSKIDLKLGYHQIRMADADVQKTSFRTHEGHYEFPVMPFGLSNAPATFQALMNQIFKQQLRKFILVFFDDILVYRKTLEEHEQHLKVALSILKENKLCAKMSKCEFGSEKLEYLGHIISAEGIATDPKKVEVMKNWPRPKNVKELRSFLGLTGYYRRFVKGYGAISKPLTNQLKKNAFCWGEEPEQAFKLLKQAMSKVPVLDMSDFSKPFIIETDASDLGIGAVLMQGRRPMAYFSKSLCEKNKGLSTYEKEFLALLTAVQKWRHYLIGGPFVIKTDQISLKHLLEQRVNHVMQHKGLCKLLGLDYTIEYKKGVDNRVADVLSRVQGYESSVKEEKKELIAVSELIPSWQEELKLSYEGDSWIQKAMEKERLEEPTNTHYTIHNGLLRYKGRLCVGEKDNWR